MGEGGISLRDIFDSMPFMEKAGDGEYKASFDDFDVTFMVKNEIMNVTTDAYRINKFLKDMESSRKLRKMILLRN